jgi:hypothetical protein
LNAIHKNTERSDAILVESVGTGMNQMAKAAVDAGIGWGIVNRGVDYLPELRRMPLPRFSQSLAITEKWAKIPKQFESLL